MSAILDILVVLVLISCRGSPSIVLNQTSDRVGPIDSIVDIGSRIGKLMVLGVLLSSALIVCVDVDVVMAIGKH